MSKDKEFFFKWVGDWLAFSKVKKSCEDNWKFKFDIKTMSNGFFLIILENEND